MSPRSAFALAVFCAVGFAGVFWLVASGAVRSFDREVLLMSRDAAGVPLGPHWLREGVRDVTALGGVLLRNLFVLAVTVALLFRRQMRQVAILVGATLSAWLVDGLIKTAVARPRPQLIPYLTDAGGFSFPSGHTLNAAAVYLTAAVMLANLSTRRPVRVAIIGAALVLVLAIGCSRVWLGVHWPSDVLAGWCIGAGFAALWLAVPWSQQAVVSSPSTRTSG